VPGGTFNSVGGKETTLAVIRAPKPIRAHSGFGLTNEAKGGSSGPAGLSVLGENFWPRASRQLLLQHQSNLNPRDV
jgi:hypothetical protein